MIKNIVFDFGGVVVDIDREQAVRAFYSLGLKDADTRLDKYHQTGIFQELEEGKVSAAEFCHLLGELCGHTLTEEETRQAWLGYFLPTDVHRLDYMEELRRNYRIYLLSNTNPFVMSWACSPAFSGRGKSLADYCDKLYLSYQIGHTKPAREIFDHLIADSGLLPEETVFVDDGSANIHMGRSLGFHTFQPENGEDWRQRFAQWLKENGK